MAIVAPNFGFTLETRLVLIFEMGQNLPPRDTDDQTACAFWVSELAELEATSRCTATEFANSVTKTVGFG